MRQAGNSQTVYPAADAADNFRRRFRAIAGNPIKDVIEIAAAASRIKTFIRRSAAATAP
jgi:hypothetical protein